MSFALATKASTALPQNSQRAASGSDAHAGWARSGGVERAIDAGGGLERSFDVDRPSTGLMVFNVSVMSVLSDVDAIQMISK